MAVRITILEVDKTGNRIEVGAAEFDTLPVVKREDYRCDKELLSFDQAVLISAELKGGKPEGTTGTHAWQRSPQPVTAQLPPEG